MKKTAEEALRSYYESLAHDPIPTIEVRLGRSVTGIALPVAMGACAAALLPILTPGSSKESAAPVMGASEMAALQDSEKSTKLDDGETSCAV